MSKRWTPIPEQGGADPIEAKTKLRIPVIGALGAILVAAVAAALIILAQSPAANVRPIIWDRESCSHCGMAISNARFACQLQTRSGKIYDFDDPGCLLTFLDEKHPQVRAIYFHALAGDRWIKAAEAAFVRGENTPMGYGFGAVPAGTPGAISLEQARREAGQHAARLASPPHDEVMR